MTLKVYLPKNIESVINTLKGNNSSSSASYFEDSPSSPSVLGRPLSLVDEKGINTILAKTVPTSLPLSHSTGEVNNSRSFDYDFVVSNETESQTNFFIADLGDTSWTCRFTEKRNGAYVFKVSQEFISNPKSFDNNSKYTLVDTSAYSSTMTSAINASVVDGFCINSLQPSYTYQIAVETSQEVLEGASSLATYISVIPDRFLNTLEEESLQNISLIVANSKKDFVTNLRFVDKLTRSAGNFVANTNSLKENTRDYLEGLDVPAFFAYTGRLQKGEALLFNTELRYDFQLLFESDFTEPLGASSVVSFDGNEGFMEYREFTFKVVNNKFKSVKIYRKHISTGSRELLVRKDILGTPLEWYNFFKPYGISCYVGLEGPLLCFAIKRDYETEDMADILQIEFETSEEGIFTSVAEGSVSFLSDKIIPTTESYLAHPNSTTIKGQSFTYVFNMSSIFPTNVPSNLASIFLRESEENYTITVARADTLNKATFGSSLPFTTSLKQTPFFNIGVGINQTLADVSQKMYSALRIPITVDSYHAGLIFDTRGTGVSKLYLKSNLQDKMLSSPAQSVRTNTELLVNTDPVKTVTPAFEQIKKLPYIVVDLRYVESLEIVPFSFITQEGLLKEQDTAEIQLKIKEDFETAEERFQILKTIAENLSVSLVSKYLLPIVPLYTLEGTFQESVMITYDPCKIDSISLYNALLKTNPDAVVTSSTQEPLKYVSGFKNGTVEYTIINPATVEHTTVDFTRYVDINTATPASLYGKEVTYRATEDLFKMEANLQDETGVVLESFVIEKKVILETIVKEGEEGEEATTEEVEKIILENTSENVLSTLTEDGLLTLSLKDTLTKERLDLTVVSTSNITLESSMLFHEKDSYKIFPLNRS